MITETFRRRFGGKWAKAEIFLGLSAVVAGLLFAQSGTARSEWQWIVPGAALFVLGGYLAMAGQRSHIYRSILEAEAALVKELQRPVE